MAKIPFPRIVQKDWIELHPYNNSQPTDFYYIQLANRLSKLIAESKLDLPIECTKQIALNVTAYFEDVVSDLGLWRAFTTLHQQRFGKRLPFYDISESEYYPDEINYPDIRLILWMNVQIYDTYEGETLINPENPGIKVVTDYIYTILDELFEEAPVNEFMENLYPMMGSTEEFLNFRAFSSWMFYQSYLMRPFSEALLEEKMEEQEESFDNSSYYKKNENLFQYALKNKLIFSKPCGPLALPMHEWLNILCPNNKENGKTNTNKDNLFLVKKNNAHSILVESAQGDLYDVDPESMQATDMLIPNESTFYGTFVKFGKQWHLNGMLMGLDIPSFEKQQEKDKETRKSIDFLTKLIGSDVSKKIIYSANMEEALLKVSDILNCPCENKITNDKQSLNNIVTFFDQEEGFVSLPKLALAITDPENPFFDKDKANDVSLQLLFNYLDCNKNLLHYLIENHYLSEFALKSLYGHSHGKELAQNNLEFLFRFFRPDLF